MKIRTTILGGVVWIILVISFYVSNENIGVAVVWGLWTTIGVLVLLWNLGTLLGKVAHETVQDELAESRKRAREEG